MKWGDYVVRSSVHATCQIMIWCSLYVHSHPTSEYVLNPSDSSSESQRRQTTIETEMRKMKHSQGFGGRSSWVLTIVYFMILCINLYSWFHVYVLLIAWPTCFERLAIFLSQEWLTFQLYWSGCITKWHKFDSFIIFYSASALDL